MAGLSDLLSVASVLAILSIVIGLSIFLMQRRADSKINRIIETQFRRQELEKKYFGTRLMTNLNLVRRNYVKLGQFLSDYLRDHSQNSKNKVRNFAAFNATNLDEYLAPAMRSDLGRLIEFIDDLKLVDELSSAFDDFASLFKDCCVDSAFEGPDSSVAEKVRAAEDWTKLVDSLLSRFGQEVSKTVE
jgi:hypothetical protein